MQVELFRWIDHLHSFFGFHTKHLSNEHSILAFANRTTKEEDP
jgi:hypothetical protein